MNEFKKQIKALCSELLVEQEKFYCKNMSDGEAIKHNIVCSELRREIRRLKSKQI